MAYTLRRIRFTTLGEEFTLRTIQCKVRQYRGDSDSIGEADLSDPKQVGKVSENVEPGSREDRTRPLWVDQEIKIRYDSKHRRMKAQAEHIVRQNEVGHVGNRSQGRILATITIEIIKVLVFSNFPRMNQVVIDSAVYRKT